MTIKNRISPVVLVLLAASGCTSVQPISVTPSAIGGSKSDGTVRVGYSSSANQPAIPDWAGAEQVALKRCQAWGYKSVEGFDTTSSTCVVMGAGILVNGAPPGACARQDVFREYQCID